MIELYCWAKKWSKRGEKRETILLEIWGTQGWSGDWWIFCKIAILGEE